MYVNCLLAPGTSAVASSKTHCRFGSCPRTCFGVTRPKQQSCRNLGRGSRTQIAAKQTQDKSDAESTTEKWGLEAGLFKVFTNKDDKGNKTKGQQAKELLTRYGSAYLITSISFAIVSFTLCYALISSGVDVPSLLQRVGLKPSDTSEKGFAAIGDQLVVRSKLRLV
ncbi:hypothetical protein WJX82_010396 [Trebouxia sp. C0006]